jgi:preprotein translocase subunit SecA
MSSANARHRVKAWTKFCLKRLQVVREGSKRVMKMRRFDVQMMGGIALHQRQDCRNAHG